MKNGLLLNVIVVEGLPVLELFSCEGKALLVWRNSFLGLYLALHVVNGVRSLNVKSDGVPFEGLDEDVE